ncbi:MAG: hypothetical protein K8J09_17625 [Planctomycetes bacterium]|nr:hypothetical protein [Planctomycetota bacterium]MCC7399717.1 hypothetical protein [Planctomycetota bacterium]
MLHALQCAAAAALFASVSLSQVSIPPHSGLYTGFSRGYYFVAQTAFNIVGLELPLDAYQAGDTAAFMVRVNGVETLRSVGNASASIATTIPILPGDTVDIIGNWSPATTTNFTAHNSYTASMTNFATVIEGVPHTIQRCGWQWDISDPSYLTGAYLAPTTGQMGRVLMYTSAGSGSLLATNTTLATGCGGSTLGDGSFYELFDGAVSVNDLANTSYTLFWSGSGYVVVPGASPLVAPTGTALSLTDDSTTALALPFTFPCPGGNLTQAWLCSNGWLSFVSTTNTDLSESVAELLTGGARLAFLWDDLNPAAGGTVHAELDAGGVYQITFTNVAEYSTSNQNNVQVSLWPNGNIEIKYGSLAVLDCLVGLSSGSAATDPGNTDLTTALPVVVNTGMFLPALSVFASTRPVTGTTWQLSVRDIPPTGLFGAEIYGVSDPGINDMGFLGMPGCPLRASPDFLIAFLVTGSTQPMAWPVPNDPSLVSLEFFVTAAVFESPASNPFGAITANGIKGRIGDF